MIAGRIYMNKYFTYCLGDPRKPNNKYPGGYEPFYIGKGAGRRIDDHIRDAKSTSKNTPKLNKIRKIFSVGLIPVITILKDNLSNIDAENLEIYYIKLFGRLDLGTGILTNLTDGGDGTIGYKITNETRAKLSKITKQAHIDGKFENAKDKISGIPRDKVTRAKIKNTLTGVKHTPERRKNISEARKKYCTEISNLTKYKIINPEGNEFLIIFGRSNIEILGYEKLYPSILKNRPLLHGRFKGWQMLKY
jgi:hypothetical protein